MAREISGTTRIAAVLGNPLDHTLSPAMHNAAYRALDLDWVYIPIATPDEASVARVAGLARAVPFVGFNVTMPFKQMVFELCDEVALTARMAGAVNTVHVVGERLVGYNTDARGVIEALESEADFAMTGQQVVLLGAGGAAGAALVAAIIGKAARITVVNRTIERAEELIERVEPHLRDAEVRALTWDDAEPAVRSAALVVNCTPIGMQPDDPSPVPGEWFGTGQVVMDMVYRPQPTRLIAEARHAGATAFDGLAMLVAQGATAIDIWEESAQARAPRAVMREAAERQLAARGEVGEGS